jgi:hypothetical protein
LRFGARGSIAFVLAGCVLIAVWQAELMERPHQINRLYQSIVGQGLYGDRVQKYFYFFYYTDKFPISIGGPSYNLGWEWRSEAWRALGLPDPEAGENSPPRPRHNQNDVKLIMEDHTVLRTGDLGKIFLLYPDAWIKGTPFRATVRWFNRLLGVTSLLALFVSFSLLNHRLFGSALVLLLGSNPFQLVELYAKNNIFGYPIAVASLMLALHAPLILGRWRSVSVYALPLVTGAFLASFRQVRAEPALVILSIAATYLLIPAGWRRRVALVALLALSATATSAAWGHYWQAKFDEAHEIVSARGGVTFDGDWNLHHALWHSLWCGLGDFGQDRGYKWNDRAGYRYGIPRVNARFGTQYRLGSGHSLRNYYTKARKHRIRAETLHEYSVVMRDKVIGDIREDPVWYASVIARRLKRVLSHATPIRLSLATGYVDLPFSAWLFIPALGWVAFLRCWDQFVLLGFYASTSVTTVAVYSGHSMPFNSAFHLVLFAVFVCWAAHGGREAWRVLRGRSPAES